MAKENETVADIIAEMRGDADADEYTPDGILGQTLNCLADRLDAAHKRELEAVGNVAKLLEAVKAVVDVGYPHNFQKEAPHIRGYCYDITRAIKKCFSALAAPARNCDAIPAEEMRKMFREELPVQLKNATEHEKKIIQLTADGIFDTVFAPYQPPKESEAAK